MAEGIGEILGRSVYPPMAATPERTYQALLREQAARRQAELEMQREAARGAAFSDMNRMPEMRAAPQAGWREKAGDLAGMIMEPFTGKPASETSQDTQNLLFAGDFTPVVGEGLGVIDTIADLFSGDLQSAGINAVAAATPFVPGSKVKKAVKNLDADAPGALKKAANYILGNERVVDEPFAFSGPGVKINSPDEVLPEDYDPKGVAATLATATQPKLTKAQRELAERKATLNRTIASRNLQPGKNVQPFVNPSEEELAAIRAEYGEGIKGKMGTEKEVDPSQTIGLFPPPSERTREQRYLSRTERPVMTPRMEAMANNPAVKKAIMEAAEKGRDVQSWYDTTPLQKLFTDEFGEEEGMKRFSDFIGYVAATSPENKIGQNIKTGSHYYAAKYGGGRDPAAEPYVRGIDTQVRTGGTSEAPEYGQKFEDVPQAFEVPPEGYGAKTQQTHMGNVNQWGKTGGLSSFDNPKIAAFYENLMGNWLPTTIDKHAVRVAAMATRDPRFLSEQGAKAFAEMQKAGLPEDAAVDQLLKTATNWTDIPDTAKGEYAAMEQIWNDTAKEMGVTPAELQAMAWIGGGEGTGLKSAPVTFMNAFADRIRRTSIRDNIPPAQVLKKMLRGELTLAELEPDETDTTMQTTAIG